MYKRQVYGGPFACKKRPSAYADGEPQFSVLLFYIAFAAGALFVAATYLNLVERAVHAALVKLAVLYFALYALVDVFHK